MGNRVSLTSCPDYDLDRVEDAVREAIEHLGGMGAFVQPGERVLLKPNIVRSAAPEKAISTHPTVVAAVARLVVQAGGQPIIVESPGGPYSPALLRVAYRTTGMVWAAEVSGAELNYDCATTQVSHPEGVLLHRLDVVQPALDADVIINLPKLKTHNLTGLTLAAKNLFGLVPGSLKIGYHAKLQERGRFCEGLLDILTYAESCPRSGRILHVMDAVVGMEGEGPSGGDPREIGAILAGDNALAVDVVAAALVGFDPLEVVTTQVAAERGLISGRLEDVEVVGESLAALRVPDFCRGIAAAVDPGLVPSFLRRFLTSGEGGGEGDARGRGVFRPFTSHWVWRQLVAFPRAGDRCTGCGLCARHCPVNAIELVDGGGRSGRRAHMDRSTCIRCYCCHELCPESAVELRKPLLGRVLMRN